MSDMKYDALVGQGVEVVERVPLPDELVPADAHVEMEAKKAAGYFTPVPQAADAGDTTGRALDKY
jgi:GTP cyclohydrolase II